MIYQAPGVSCISGIFLDELVLQGRTGGADADDHFNETGNAGTEV